MFYFDKIKQVLKNKRIIAGIFIIIIVILSLPFVINKIYPRKEIFLPETAVYLIDNQETRLKQSEIFSDPIYKDLDGDGDDDAVLMFTQSPGGSGTFFYVAAAINHDGSFQGTNAIFLGDRIAPQNINFLGITIIVNYADRRPEEPMTTKPSQGISKYLIIENGLLQETDQPAG